MALKDHTVAIISIAVVALVTGFAFYATTPLERAHRAVRNILLDSSGARFRADQLGQGGHYVCGEVSARNGLGAMAGFAPYVYDRKSGEASVFLDPTSAMALFFAAAGAHDSVTADQAEVDIKARCPMTKLWSKACPSLDEAAINRAAPLCELWFQPNGEGLKELGKRFGA